MNTIIKQIQEKLQKIVDSDDTRSLEKINEFIGSLSDSSKEIRNYSTNLEVDTFLNENEVFFHPTSHIFFIYEDNHYRIGNEDDVYSKISQHFQKRGIIDSDFKQISRQKIFRTIKTSYHIVDNVPNSETIQTLLNFFVPNIFKTRNEAKYFITIIGDIINRKHNNIIFINISLKNLLKKISKYVNIYFVVTNLLSFFKLKYHDHDLNICRILMSSQFKCEYFSLDDQFFIDLICVSLHYSKRFTTSDNYLSIFHRTTMNTRFV